MDKLVCGVHHVAVKCRSFEKFQETLNFYGQILGMDIIRTWGEGSGSGAMLSAGNCLLELFADGAVSDHTGAVNHFALATDNVDACINTVKNAGYEITVFPKDIVIGSEIPYPARIGFCIGPNGEEIEFFCEMS